MCKINFFVKLEEIIEWSFKEWFIFILIFMDIVLIVIIIIIMRIYVCVMFYICVVILIVWKILCCKRRERKKISKLKYLELFLFFDKYGS